MRLHPRYQTVRQASLELGKAVLVIFVRNELTYGELVKILSEELGDAAKHLIRTERHPNNPEKKGDEE